MKKTKLMLFASIIGIISLVGLAFVGCTSATALSIAISSPEDGATVSESPITITGTVSGYPRGEVNLGEQTVRLVPEVTVNGIRADVDANGGFSAQVELTEGENTIEAVVMLNNIEARDSITVTYTPAGLTLNSIAVTPETPENLAVGATQQFTATGTYSDNSTADITAQVAWASSDVAVATIDATGLATGVAVGTTDIIASLSEVTSLAVTLTVVAATPTLSSIAVTPETPENLVVGATQQFTATGTYSDNSTADITAEVTWASSDVAVATIDAAGLATGVAEGTTDITASLDEVTSPAITLTVGAAEPTLISIGVEPAAPANLAVGATQQFTATGTYSDNSTANITAEVTWASSDVAIATIDAAGLATGVTAGTIEITASLSEINSPVVTLTVVAAPTLTSIAVEPAAPAELAIGATQQFTAIGTYSDNSTANITAQVTWASSDAAIATIDASGLATGVAEGTSNVTASMSEITSPAITLIVVSSAPALSIEITSPQNGAEITQSPITVTGSVSDAEATVAINGVVVVVNNDASFTAEVEATEGQNTIVAVAILGEVQAEGSVTVTFSPPPGPVPTIEITSPADGAELTESLVTVTGTISPPGAVATVNGVVVAGENGTFSAQVVLNDGQNTITAAATMGDGELRDEDSITVTFTPQAPALTSIVVTPATPENLAVGATQQFTATGTYSDNPTADITSQVTWASSDVAIATIDATGLATGVAVGTTDITASLSGIDSPAVPLTVVAAAPTLTSIAVTPSSPAELAVGATQQFTATGTYSDNSTANITAEVTWASSDVAIATIDAAGLATGVTAGTIEITASLSEINSPVVTLTVVAP